MTAPNRRRAGLSLVELLIVIVMFGAITGATLSMFRSQDLALRQNTDQFDLAQNVRSALELSERTIRTMGAGVTGEQPMLVYGAQTVLAFNTDYVERDTVDMRWAAYFNPDVPAAESVVWQAAAATAIPNSAPSYTYPSLTYRLGNGTLSPAETYILYFSPDTETARGDDFILWQRVNNGTPEMLARNILAPSGGLPFFDYLLHRVAGGGDQLITASQTANILPLIRRPVNTATNAADSAAFVRPDSVRAVRIAFRVTNGKVGADERIRELHTTVETPNNGVFTPSICGRAPLPPNSFSLADPGLGTGEVVISWTRSPDQDGAEVDIRQYIIWRRPVGTPLFSEPLAVIAAEQGQVAYQTSFFDHTPGDSYIFGIAAQDCTPSLSPLLSATVTTSVAP